MDGLGTLIRMRRYTLHDSWKKLNGPELQCDLKWHKYTSRRLILAERAWVTIQRLGGIRAIATSGWKISDKGTIPTAVERL